MDVSAKITGIKYKPFLCRPLNQYNLSDLELALSKEAAFILNISPNKQIAVSWWVSPKRTRSYPYARVYDTLGFSGKKVTIIPIMKDEGSEGDRDFLQWDTVSLMSLLGVYVIISYYSDAKKNKEYKNKITNQKFAISHIIEEIKNLCNYQSDALHWNLFQIEKVGEIAKKALNSYEKISKKLGVLMHSAEFAQKRIEKLLKGKEIFMELSRELARKAQEREVKTKQPKEKLTGKKAKLTIENYLGGIYYFTCDEFNIQDEFVYLIESKHSKENIIPSLDDIKDGLIKMILFTNLKEIKIGDKLYHHKSILKLTSNKFSSDKLNSSQKEILQSLKKEAKENNFQVLINDINIEKIINF